MWLNKMKCTKCLKTFHRRGIILKVMTLSSLLFLCLTCILFTLLLTSSIYSTDIFYDEERCSDLIQVQGNLSLVLRLPGGRPEVKVTSVNCLALMEGDAEELKKAMLHMQSNRRLPVSPTQIMKQAQDCEEFRRKEGYDMFPVAEEERNFPVAFSILVHKDIHQLERLLRIIYRPHNLYCVHVDAKSDKEILHAVQSISMCFSNVFIPEKLEAITYAHFSRLQADLRCMEELFRRGSTWKYVINLTGQMFPLRTNLEIVKILQTYEGSNDIEALSRYIATAMRIRYKYRYEITNHKLVNSHKIKEPAPLGITLVKGSAYGAFTRPFIEYVLQNPAVQEFLTWTRDVYSPDEFFWASLNSRWINPMFHSPGGHDFPPERKPWLATYAAWKKKDSCGGKFVRDVCIFGVSDLPSLVGRKELFANKFYEDFQPLALDCMEEWIVNKTKHHLPIDLEFYRNLKRLLPSNDLLS